MDSGFRVLQAINCSRESLKRLAGAAVQEHTGSGGSYFFKDGFRFLWLYARQAASVDAVMLRVMSLIGGSPRDQRWRQNNVGQRILDDLSSPVRQISQEAAIASELDWHSGYWLAAARIYLSYLRQSHTFGGAESSGITKGPEQTEIEGDSIRGS